MSYTTDGHLKQPPVRRGRLTEAKTVEQILIQLREELRSCVDVALRRIEAVTTDVHLTETDGRRHSLESGRRPSPMFDDPDGS